MDLFVVPVPIVNSIRLAHNRESDAASTWVKPRSPNTWQGTGGTRPKGGRRSFATTPMGGIASMVLFVVPALSFRLISSLLILCHGRRQILWLGMTAHPSAEWMARQLTEACGRECPPRYIIRDRDSVDGEIFTRRLRAMGIRDRPTAPRSPWQNGHTERLIGSIRRECLDHVVVFGERHLRHVLLSALLRQRADTFLSE